MAKTKAKEKTWQETLAEMLKKRNRAWKYPKPKYSEKEIEWALAYVASNFSEGWDVATPLLEQCKEAEWQMDREREKKAWYDEVGDLLVNYVDTHYAELSGMYRMYLTSTDLLDKFWPIERLHSKLRKGSDVLVSILDYEKRRRAWGKRHSAITQESKH